VFFNISAAAEPSANVCVAHGSLRNDPSVYPTFCNKPLKHWCCYNCIELRLRISSQVISVCFDKTSGSHSEPRLKNTAVHWYLQSTDFCYNRPERRFFTLLQTTASKL